MPLTIKVNGKMNSLVHKGSNHFSSATIPDVCKTPSPGGPVPIPYPNLSQSASLAKGTTTVKADGGMMCANKGSEFSLSNGDNAGVAGGVKSSTFMKESTWITCSFDVKLQGKGAARLSDKKFQNHENTVDMMGAGGFPVSVLENFTKVLCRFLKECTDAVDQGKTPSKAECDAPGVDPTKTKGMERGNAVDKCCKDKIHDVKKKSTTPLSKAVQTDPKVSVPGLGGDCFPDVVVGTPPSCAAVYDFKTSCPPLPPSAPPPRWPVYGDGTNRTRKAANRSWHGKSQADVYQKACGVSPKAIHANSPECKS